MNKNVNNYSNATANNKYIYKYSDCISYCKQNGERVQGKVMSLLVLGYLVALLIGVIKDHSNYPVSNPVTTAIGVTVKYALVIVAGYIAIVIIGKSIVRFIKYLFPKANISSIQLSETWDVLEKCQKIQTAYHTKTVAEINNQASQMQKKADMEHKAEVEALSQKVATSTAAIKAEEALEEELLGTIRTAIADDNTTSDTVNVGFVFNINEKNIIYNDRNFDFATNGISSISDSLTKEAVGTAIAKALYMSVLKEYTGKGYEWSVNNTPSNVIVSLNIQVEKPGLTSKKSW